MDSVLTGFPPLARPDARLLVLGSMPGQRSLAEQQYYAQPRNAFWAIMGALFGAVPELPYPQRCARLLDQQVAVWDVLARCRRIGSLDQKIRLADAEFNDFAAFFRHHRQVTTVACNGQLAARLFTRRVLPGLEAGRTLEVQVLPSTSPAMARLSPERKLACWRDALRDLAPGAAAVPPGHARGPAAQRASSGSG